MQKEHYPSEKTEKTEPVLPGETSPATPGPLMHPGLWKDERFVSDQIREIAEKDFEEGRFIEEGAPKEAAEKRPATPFEEWPRFQYWRALVDKNECAKFAGRDGSVTIKDPDNNIVFFSDQGERLEAWYKELK